MKSIWYVSLTPMAAILGKTVNIYNCEIFYKGMLLKNWFFLHYSSQFFFTFSLPIDRVRVIHQMTRAVWRQIMACRLFGAKPMFETMQGYCTLGHWRNLNDNTTCFAQRTDFENLVWIVAAILFRPQLWWYCIDGVVSSGICTIYIHTLYTKCLS